MNQTKKNHSMSFARLFSIVLTSFLLGVLVSFYLSSSNVKNSIKSPVSSFQNHQLDLGQFWEVYEIVWDEFLDKKVVSNDEIVTGAIKWMVDALWDKHSQYFDPSETNDFNKALSGDFEWIGAVVEKLDFGVEIDRIIKGSPAKKYGLRKSDVIIKADEYELADMSLYDAVDKIKWPAGTKVVLTILRPWKRDVLEIEVIREKIKIPSIESELFEDNIGYISINLFGDDTSWDFEEALDGMQDSSGLIIDLRDNGGWYLQSAVEILSRFVDQWEVLVSTDYKKAFSNTVYKSISYEPRYQWKIVVLINENSASASEITAAALREYDLAIVVWKKSYGKGSVQNPFMMPDGSMLKLTIAQWLTPNKTQIDGEGITPDIEIDFKDEDFPDLETGWEFYDRQLEEAKKILQLFKQKQFIGVTVEQYKNSIEE